MRIAFFALLAAGGVAAVAAPAGGAAACRLRRRSAPRPTPRASPPPAARRRDGSGASTGAAFAAAACASARRAPCAPPISRLFPRLLVRNAEGAAEPAVYDDAEERPAPLIIEYAFADGAAPAQAAIETAMRCWRNPQTAGCDQRPLRGCRALAAVDADQRQRDADHSHIQAGCGIHHRVDAAGDHQQGDDPAGQRALGDEVRDPGPGARRRTRPRRRSQRGGRHGLDKPRHVSGSVRSRPGGGG